MRVRCRDCKYHDDFTWVCCNGDSDMCAEATNDNYWCRHGELENANNSNKQNNNQQPD